MHYSDSELAPRALYNAGEINYRYLKDYDGAVYAFRKLLGSYSWSEFCPSAQGQLADIYMYKLQDYKQAIIEYQKAISHFGRKKESERFQYEIAMAYFNLMNFGQQRVELNLLLKSFPETELKPDAYLAMANSYFIEGMLEDAAASYKKVIELFPDTGYAVESKFKLAATLEEKENLRGSLKLLNEIKVVYPNPEVIKYSIERVKKRLKIRRR